MIAATPALFDAAAERLRARIGPVETTSETMPFDFTHYYDAETGSPLLRRFVRFAPGPGPERLAEIKRTTNAIEAEFASAAAPQGPPRPINLDPGWLSAFSLVLASCKPFAHRVYLRDGVWAEVTLLWRDGRWRPLEWTFPDYASGRYDAFLTAARDALRAGEAGGSP
jgi:hypothetical protein